MIYRAAFQLRELAKEYGYSPSLHDLVRAIATAKTLEQMKANVKAVIYASL